jgi:hypothetical protein
MARALTRVSTGILLCSLLFACQREGKLDRYGQLPQFTLQNQLGDKFSDADLRGRVVVVDFILPRCLPAVDAAARCAAEEATGGGAAVVREL